MSCLTCSSPELQKHKRYIRYKNVVLSFLIAQWIFWRTLWPTKNNLRYHQKGVENLDLILRKVLPLWSSCNEWVQQSSNLRFNICFLTKWWKHNINFTWPIIILQARNDIQYFINPKKAGLFKGIFLWGTQFDIPPRFPLYFKRN